MSAGCYLWDYLRRSGAAGYLVPLSGGIDSCSTAVLVFSMTRLVIAAMKEGKAVVVISSYLPEILAISDRILVARLGRIVAEFDAAAATEDGIMYAAIH